MSAIRKVSLGFAVLAGMVALLHSGMLPIPDRMQWLSDQFTIGQSKAAQASPHYITAIIEKTELRRTVTTTGTLNANVNVEVGSQLSGQVAEVLVDFNDEVRKGQPLARLDQRSFQARATEAQATIHVAEMGISVAQAKLERARIDAEDSEAQRAVLRARVDNARVKLQAVERDLRRKEMLRDRQVGASVELEDAQSKVDSARAAFREVEAVQAAQENTVAAAKVDVRRAQSELHAATASLAQKRSLLQIAQLDLDRTTIRSPVDGVVVGRTVNAGQTLATTLEAKTLFTVAGDLRQMLIHAKVDEADIGRIREGQEALFTVDAHPGRQFPATVRQVRKASQVQQNVVTYTVLLTAENLDNLLLPGMTSLVRITVGKTDPVLTIPLAALRFSPNMGQAISTAQTEVSGGKAASVWIKGEDGLPKPVVIGLGDDNASHAAVLSGDLAQGDRVIVGEAAAASPRKLFGIRIGF